MVADTDVIVIGAGPIGSALAVMLGRAGLKTLLLDRARFPRDKACGEGLMPAGAHVLEELGIPTDRFPLLAGVTYRVPGMGSLEGTFGRGGAGRGTRRLAFDQLLIEVASATPNVDVRLGDNATGLDPGERDAIVTSASGPIRARHVVGADGLRSQVARWIGAWRPPVGRRLALTGHVLAPGHAFDRIVVTLLDGCEVYLAPTSSNEVLVALLGSKDALRTPGETVRAGYARRIAQAHPELAGAMTTRVRGAGPFWIRPATVAAGRVFLVGDAAGFLDPLTGDGISAGFLAARRLAGLLGAGVPQPDQAYRRWEASQWRRRVFMTRLVLTLTGSAWLRRRALRGLRRRPATLSRLLEVNDGSSGVSSLSLRDLAVLAGI
jgi:flavin-dependent dehydrogenase